MHFSVVPNHNASLHTRTRQLTILQRCLEGPVEHLENRAPIARDPVGVTNFHCGSSWHRKLDATTLGVGTIRHALVDAVVLAVNGVVPQVSLVIEEAFSSVIHEFFVYMKRL